MAFNETEYTGILSPARRRSQVANPYTQEPYETGGVTGPGLEPDINPLKQALSGIAPNYLANSSSYDPNKLADPAHNSAKYQMARVFQKYDPRLGITPEILSELNALGIGTFAGAGGGDLRVTGAQGWGTGNDFLLDVIGNFGANDDTTHWQSGFGQLFGSTPAPVMPTGMPTPGGVPVMPIGTGAGGPNPALFSAGYQGGGMGGGTAGTTYTPAEAAAMGLGWVPPDHPQFGQPGFVGWKTAPGAGGTPGAPASINSLGTGLLQSILTNPQTMSATNVAQLKEKNKEGAVAMQEQLKNQLATSAALRGTSGSGFQGAQERRIGEAVMSDVLRGNRDVDLGKMVQDRQDELGALGAYFDFLGQGRADRALDIQYDLGSRGLDIDAGRLGESGRQFDLSHQLALQQFGEQMRQFNNQLGFNWAQFNYNSQMDPWKLIFGLY